MTADQGQCEKFMAKLSKSGLELQKDFSRLSPENQKRFMQEVNQRLKCFGHAVTITDILHRRKSDFASSTITSSRRRRNKKIG